MPLTIDVASGCRAAVNATYRCSESRASRVWASVARGTGTPHGHRSPVEGGCDEGQSARGRHVPRPAPLLRVGLIQYGESVKVVQARLGHASAMETLDTYGHLWPESEDSTRQAIDAVLGNPAGQARGAAAG